MGEFTEIITQESLNDFKSTLESDLEASNLKKEDVQFRPNAEEEDKAEGGEGFTIREHKPKPKKMAVAKGFFNSDKGKKGILYGEEGSKEGVLPENAGDPLGYIPKKLRQSCKIVDTGSEEYQKQDRARKQAEANNNKTNEMRSEMAKDMEKWVSKHHKPPDKWAPDTLKEEDEDENRGIAGAGLVGGGGVTKVLERKNNPSTKASVDYSKFDAILAAEDEDVIRTDAAAQETKNRNWYVDSKSGDVKFKKSSSPAVATGSSKQRGQKEAEEILGSYTGDELRNFDSLLHNSTNPATSTTETAVNSAPTAFDNCKISKNAEGSTIICLSDLDEPSAVVVDADIGSITLSNGSRKSKIDLPSDANIDGIRAKASTRKRTLTITVPSG